MIKRQYRCLRRQGRSSNRALLRRIGVFSLVLALMTVSAVFAYDRYMRSLQPTRGECVILLHGLFRTDASMALIEYHLIRQGYGVVNIDYDSTHDTISSVAGGEVASAVAAAKAQGYDRIHFVSHSLGALIIRTFLQDHRLPEGSRIVMLAPPNQGSELADWAYETFPRLSRMTGPAAAQLGTKGEPLASRLDRISPEVGIIVGKKSWNPLFSNILPGEDDGAVTVERAKLKEMQDFLVVPCNHTSIVVNKNVRQQVTRFLQTGRFAPMPPHEEDIR
ncbi:MAG: alpha/beta hydrolase [Desulfobacteraceae bacterium]|jgi:triacylglycerol lipase